MSYKDILPGLLTALENNTVDQFDAPEIIVVLTAADDLYYNDQESFISDSEYDTLHKVAERLEPHNVYFTGLGADIRGGKIKLPYEMGSLNQVDIGDITDWVGDWTLQNEGVVITDKMDGVSAMVVYDQSGKLQIAYSRGNGVEGADITRHIRKMKNVPQEIESGPLVVRGEVIISKFDFKKVRTMVKSRNGSEYKNARNMAAGIMNSKTNPDVVYPHIEFIAYDIMNVEWTKNEILQHLLNTGFIPPFHNTAKGDLLTDNFLADYLKVRRDITGFEIDGLVIEVDGSLKRSQMNPTRETLNPSYAIKYKVADAENQAVATVKNVEWNVSKHGYLKPRVQIEPVELVGVTIQNLTGFNAKFIEEGGIGPGARIQITRSGEVIPFLQKVIEPTTPQMPDVEWKWSTVGECVDAVQIDHEKDDGVQIKYLIDFFSSLDAPYLKKGNVEKLYNAGYKTPESIIEMIQPELISVLGENGKKVSAGLIEKLTNIPEYKLVGAFSNERGIGVRRMKKLQTALGADGMLYAESPEEFAGVTGFSTKTAQQAYDVIQDFHTFYSKIRSYVQFLQEETSAGGSLVGEKIVMTGFRDKNLAAQIEAEGGEIQSNVSSKTTILVAKNPDSTSGKMKKARDAGVQIMGIDEFNEMLRRDGKTKGAVL